VAKLPGFTRGLDFAGPLAFIGLSQVRESAVFSGIPLVERGQERTCGVWVVHLETGQTIGFLRFEAGVQEIFAVQVLPALRFPEVLEWHDERLAHTYVLPDAALAEVARPTAEALARSPAVHFEHGTACYRSGQLPEAIAAYRRCVALDPTFPHARYRLGVALGDAGDYDEAVTWLQQVLAVEPDHAEASNSLGYCYGRLGQPAKAVAAFERAVALRPDDVQAHVNLGLTLLQLGDYPRGFTEYEWRRRAEQSLPSQCPHPQWDGRPIPHQTLLIHTEQGAGDVIQFARYLPLAAQRCGTLSLVCPADLMPLMATLPGIGQIHEPGTITAAEFDTYLPMLSLPRLFGTTLATIPAAVPYFDVAALRPRTDLTSLPQLEPSGRPKVGLVWAGGPTDPRDRLCAARLYRGPPDPGHRVLQSPDRRPEPGAGARAARPPRTRSGALHARLRGDGAPPRPA
jgi:Flp pilus assembly protein TadD